MVKQKVPALCAPGFVMNDRLKQGILYIVLILAQSTAVQLFGSVRLFQADPVPLYDSYSPFLEEFGLRQDFQYKQLQHFERMVKNGGFSWRPCGSYTTIQGMCTTCDFDQYDSAKKQKNGSFNAEWCAKPSIFGRVKLNAAIFRQTATKSSTARGEKDNSLCILTPNCAPNNFSTGRQDNRRDVALGDLYGHPAVLPLFYAAPEDGSKSRIDKINKSINETFIKPFRDAMCFNALNSDDDCDEDEPSDCAKSLAEVENRDPRELFGYYSFGGDPSNLFDGSKYTKNGVRFSGDVYLFAGFGFQFQCGISEVRQYIFTEDLSCNAGPATCASSSTSGSDTCAIHEVECDCKKAFIQSIMNQPQKLAKSAGIVIDDYISEHHFEDLRLYGYWRHAFEFNRDSFHHPHGFFVPFVRGEVGFDTDEAVPNNVVLAVPLGNNGHLAYGMRAGFMFEFSESIGLSVDAGFTRYEERRYDGYRVPLNEFQQTLTIAATDLIRKPGTSWTAGIVVNGHHIIECLSAWAEYRFAQHDEDTLTLCTSSANKNLNEYLLENKLVQKMEEETAWVVHRLNFGFHYDVSRVISLGAAFQIPLSQRRAYSAATLLGCFTISF